MDFIRMNCPMAVLTEGLKTSDESELPSAAFEGLKTSDESELPSAAFFPSVTLRVTS